MHFLSHYYTELPADNPLFVTALAIPDLAHGFSKAYNSVIKKAPSPTDENLRQIHLGILKHYEGDKKFHNSKLFMQHTTLTTQSFMKEGLDRSRLRLSVIAHIAVEMMIDRHIIFENESVCDDYYKLIVHADEKMLETYFNHFGLLTAKNSFFATFKFFTQSRFLYRLKEIENIVFALNKLYGSVTKTEFTEDEKKKFVAALYNIDNTIRYSWQEILKA